MVNLTLPESSYYGPEDKNKKEFMKLYKKLKLKWDEHAILDGKEAPGWFNTDKTEYVLKLHEIKGMKRLSIVGCQSIVDFFKGLGAKEFEIWQDEVKEKQKIEIHPKLDMNRKSFIGADLDSHYRFEQRLKNMPDNWGVKWR